MNTILAGFALLAHAVSSPLKGHPELFAQPAPGAQLKPALIFFFVPAFTCDEWLITERATGCEVARCDYQTAKALGRAWDFIPE